MAIVEEQPTDKVYMWMVFLTTTAWAVIITLAVLAIYAYSNPDSGYKIEKVDPFTEQ